MILLYTVLLIKKWDTLLNDFLTEICAAWLKKLEQILLLGLQCCQQLKGSA